MPKYFQIFTIIIIACLGLVLVVSPIIAIFNTDVSLMLLNIIIGLIYIIFCVIGLVRLLEEDED